MKNVSEYLTMFGKIKMYVEYEHVEELGSRKLSGPQLANRKQKMDLLKYEISKGIFMYCIKSSAKKLTNLAILYMIFKVQYCFNRKWIKQSRFPESPNNQMNV